jgi:hypothetical protein
MNGEVAGLLGKVQRASACGVGRTGKNCAMPLVPTDREAGAAQQRWRNGQEPAFVRRIGASAALAEVAFPLHSID